MKRKNRDNKVSKMTPIEKNNYITSIVDSVLEKYKEVNYDILLECENNVYNELLTHSHWIKEIKVYHIQVENDKFDIIVEWVDRHKKQSVIIQPLRLSA